MQKKAERYQREYLEHPKNRQLRQHGHELNLKEGEKEHLRIKEAFLNFQMVIEADEAEEEAKVYKPEKQKKAEIKR